MTALTAITPTNTGAVNAGAAVAASDTVARSIMGSLGAYLEIINNNVGADSMTISDPGVTPAGNPLAGGTIAVSVAASTSKIFRLRPDQVSAAGLVTITHSVISSVTYKLYPVG